MTSLLAFYHGIFLAYIAPALEVTIIPSVIVALTPYPKASKVLKVLSYVLQVLSFLTHKDQPGTMKLPFMIKGASKALRVVPLLLAATLSVSGCAWLRAHPSAMGALQCAESIAAEVIYTVAGAFGGGSVDWAAVGRAEEQYGLDAVICAAKKLANPEATAAANPKIVQGAQAYLAAKGVK